MTTPAPAEKRNVLLLATAQALFQTAGVLVMTLSGLVGLQLAPEPGLATLPIALFSMLRLGLTPEVNALGALVVLVVGSMLALAIWLLGRRRA